MSVGHQVARALSALWLARIVGIALNLLLIPLLFRQVAAQELGIWLLMGQAGAIIALMDFGITSVFTRRIAMASARNPAGPEVADLLASARQLYVAVATLVFLAALAAGWLMLPKLGLDDAAGVRVQIAWAILCVAYAYNLFGAMWMAVVSGLGHVAVVSILGTALGLASVALQAIVVLLDGGVVALATVMLAGSLVQRWLMLRVLQSRQPWLFANAGRPRRELARNLLRTSSRWWLTELGAIALLRTDKFFIAAFLQASQIPPYYAAYSIMVSLSSAALAIAEAANVFVSRLWREDEPGAIHALVLSSTRIGLTLALCGAMVMAVIGDSLIAAWIGPAHFVGRPTLLVLCVTLVLYVQQSLLLGFSRATENETYAPCYLAAGMLNVAVTWALIGSLGVLGVALGTFIAQLATTSWYVPRSALRQLQISWKTYSTEVLLPCAQVGVLTGSVTVLAASSASAGAHLQRAAAGGLAGSAAALVGLWFLTFDAETRRHIRGGAAAALRRLRARPA